VNVSLQRLHCNIKLQHPVALRGPTLTDAVHRRQKSRTRSQSFNMYLWSPHFRNKCTRNFVK
jgi:hypothetical protein